MFNPWFSAILLAFEVCEVVTLRMLNMGLNGAGTSNGAHLRANNLLSSMTLDSNPRGREHVTANASRQGSTSPRPVSEHELDRILRERTGRLPHRQSA